MWWLIQQMWWLIDSAPDFWGRSPGFESGIYHNGPDALQDHCEIQQKISGQRGKPTPEAKKRFKKKYCERRQGHFVSEDMDNRTYCERRQGHFVREDMDNWTYCERCRQIGRGRQVEVDVVAYLVDVVAY